MFININIIHVYEWLENIKNYVKIIIENDLNQVLKDCYNLSSKALIIHFQMLNIIMMKFNIHFQKI